MAETISHRDQSIQVLVRIRPTFFNGIGRESTVVNKLQNGVEITCGASTRHFQYDNVIDMDMTQEDVFQSCGKQITNNVIDGYNGYVSVLQLRTCI